MSSLAKQDQSARKFWGDRLIKGAWTDSEVRVLEKHPDLSDYNLGMKLRRTPSSVRAKRSQLASELDTSAVVTRRLRESRKAKQMEQLNVERRDAYVKKVIEDAPPLTRFKRALVEKAFNAQSPFDSIKRIGKDGAEYWLARDLMPMLGYGDKWQNFEAAVDRAKIAAEVQGHDVKTLFTSVSKKTGGRPQQDYELARFACYLVAMNGDPRKSEIASAMSYFAIKTREAETQSPALALPQDYASALRELANTVEAKELAEKRAQEQAEIAAKRALEIEAQAPAVEKAAAHTASDDSKGRQAFAREVQQWGMRKGVGIKQKSVYDLLRRRGMLIAEGRHDSNNPTAQAVKNGWAELEQGVNWNGYAWATAKLTPAGQDMAWKWISKDIELYGAELNPPA